jgi:hypothetical protein
MGNTSSTKNAKKDGFNNFYNILDFISTYYILTMNFESLTKLSDKSYCDKLVVLTSDIIERYFNDTEIKYLQYRIKNGVEVNELNKEKVIFVNKDNLDSLDISNDKFKSIKKKRICIGIAKYYIKIAHLFAAIIMTINPVYSYKDENGNTVKKGILEKDTIPKNVNKKLYKLNICDNRIRALKRGEFYDLSNNTVTINPKVCDMNILKSSYNDDDNNSTTNNDNNENDNNDTINGANMGADVRNNDTINDADERANIRNNDTINGANMGENIRNNDTINGVNMEADVRNNDTINGANMGADARANIRNNDTINGANMGANTNARANARENMGANVGGDNNIKNLEAEPGIPELFTLYFDDNYDYSNGTFTGMSDATKIQFKKDLKTFYTAFTGNTDMPPEITKFSDIKLRDYSGTPSCKQPNNNNKITVNKKDKLFINYADNINKMIKNAYDNQLKLLSVINELFVYINDPYTDKKVIRVNPSLTEDSLQKIVEKTRKIIIDLYVKCEMDYVNGVKLYEAIVESKILETTQKQIETLKREAVKIQNTINLEKI